MIKIEIEDGLATLLEEDILWDGKPLTIFSMRRLKDGTFSRLTQKPRENEPTIVRGKLRDVLADIAPCLQGDHWTLFGNIGITPEWVQKIPQFREAQIDVQTS